MTATDSVRLAHLQRLEAEAIHVMREAVAEAAELIVQRLFDDYNEVTI